MPVARVRDQYHHGDLESALIATARKFTKRNGIEHLSLRKVAQEIGVSPSAAYHYFPDRDALMAAVGFSLFEELADYQERELAKITGTTAKAAKERYRALGKTYFEWAIKEPHFFNLMFSEHCLVDSKSEEKREDNRAYINLTKCLDELVSTGALEERMRGHSELLSWTVVHGATSLIVGGHLDPENYESILDDLEFSLGIRK
jgi:AcrR family transcriptional regulator